MPHPAPQCRVINRYPANHAGTVAAARENLRYGDITAPFDGGGQPAHGTTGRFGHTRQTLLKITDTAAGVRLLVNVPEKAASGWTSR